MNDLQKLIEQIDRSSVTETELEEYSAGNQSDWNQTDNTKSDFIKNKPTIPTPYTLPVASSETLGGVKVGNNLSIDENGVLSSQGGSEVITKTLLYTGEGGTLYLPDEEVAALGIDFKAGKTIIVTIPAEYLGSTNPRYAQVIGVDDDGYLIICSSTQLKAVYNESDI